MIRFENALTSRALYRRLKQLYRSAFPANERPPLSFLKIQARRGKCDMLAALHRDDFAGLVILVRHGDVIYVFFLAVEETLRGQGLGTEILAMLARNHPGCRLMLCIENVHEPCDDLPLRLRRKAFYQRCGYREAGFTVTESGVTYEMLSTAPVTWEDYRRLMTAFLGPTLFRYVHRPV